MGSVERAVVEFDEEVRAPWRPLLVAMPVPADSTPVPGLRRPAGRSPSRVGVCRPHAPVVTHTHVTSPVRPDRAGRGLAGRRRSTRVRLTVRARRLAVALALCGGVVLGSLLDSLMSGGAGGGGLHLAGVGSVVVEPGDTLWSIAESVADGADVRVVVDHIQELNGLEGSALAPGQVLLLP